MPIKDITGQRFGRLVAIKPVRVNEHRQSIWQFRCDCGKVVEKPSCYILCGDTKSCGCYLAETRRMPENHRTHGGYYDRLHKVWTSMLSRCRNKNADAYKNYGGRGITVCKEWLSYPVFKEWALSAGYDESAPRGECTIDRIDVNKGYCPENCRWIPMSEQYHNRRDTVNYTVNGETHCLAVWARTIGVTPASIDRVVHLYGDVAEQYIKYKLDHPDVKRAKIKDVLEYSESLH